MPVTISTDQAVSAACAVFKIDLKGRFVYIDDETEDLLGLSREELFGKSIYEFISDESHQMLDTVLGHHKRYESFYESMPLTIRENEGVLRRVEAVITLNFIGGNPVNYQFILINSQAPDLAPIVNWERQLLEMTQLPSSKIDFDQIAEMFCTIGGFAVGECYLIGNERSPVMAGSYPHQDPGHSAPAYLEQFRESGKCRFSFVPEDRLPQEGFGNGKSEAVICLPFHDKSQLLIWLHSQAEYRPATSRINDIRLFSHIWSVYFQSIELASSPGSQLTILGQAGDALGIGMVVANGEYDIVYANECFSEITGIPENRAKDNSFEKLYERLDICDLQAQPLPFGNSPFARASRQRCLAVDCFVLPGQQRPLTVMAGPMNIAETSLFIYCFIPYQNGTAEACSMNRSDTKLILSVAHDIRAPLIAIEAFAKRLQANYKDQLDNDGRFAVDCIVENGKILEQMIEGLGEMSQNREFREAPEKLYTRKIFEDMVSYLRATYPHCKYRIKIPKGLPELTMPRRKLIQLFRNILDNAFKYSTASNEPVIRIEYDLVDGWHQFSISDNGPGIEDDYRQKIFAPFFRAPEAVSLPGTGMGLTIASEIIASWGGKIWLDDSFRNGTRISLTLPHHFKG